MTNAQAGKTGPSLVRGWVLVFLLTLAYTTSFIDRQVLNLLVEPLKADFGLADTELSLLQGLAFTSAYIALSPLFGRLADTGSRRGVLVAAIMLWSIGTSLCGLSRNYWQLFLARCGVGGAEAGLTPAAWSIIADSFPPHMLPRALSVFLMGPYIGGGLAMIFGGLLLEASAHWDLSGLPVLEGLKPWQLVFLAASAPGFLIAGLFLFVREPERRDVAGSAAERMTYGEMMAVFREHRAFYGNFYVGMSCLIMTLYAFPAWMPTVLIRRFGASAADVGMQYGAAVLIAGSVGVLTGPWLAGLFARRGRRDNLLVVALLAAMLLVPVTAGLWFVGDYGSALALATLASFLYSLPQAVASSALQLATPNRMRGIASSVYVFAASVAGLGLAPTIVALLTDFVFRDDARVGESLALTCMVAAMLAMFFISRAVRAYRRMLAN